PAARAEPEHDTARAQGGGRAPSPHRRDDLLRAGTWALAIRAHRQADRHADRRVCRGREPVLVHRYHRYGARVANVFAAFRSTDFGAGGPAGASRSRRTPPNVTKICSLTWMCAAPPRGPNEHANDAGYQLIARAFWRAITS